MAITPLSGIGPTPALTPPSPSSSSPAATGFGDALKQIVESVDGASGQANQAIGQMLDGTGDVHEAMIAMQKADTMLELTVQIRNKIVQAYQDVMKMSI